MRKRALLLITALGVLPVGALGVFASGCGSAAGDYCDEVCNCEGCSDREYEDCKIKAQASIDTASAYDCDTEAQDMEDCFLAKYRCVQEHAVLENGDCANELDRLSKCQARGSSLDK